ncbi:MAG: PP2C family protein-serine/threonine phosphatase [bacterium]
MIEPKEFYRKIDFLLSRIGAEKTGKDFLFTIVKELEDTFGNDLHIGGGRIYEKAEDEFVLIYKPTTPEPLKIPSKLKLSSEAVQKLLKTKTYIFDNPVFSIDSAIHKKKEYAIPAAITIHSQDSRWIFIFELKSGWVREEIEFCLNAVRTMLNYRLFSESVKSELEQAIQIQQSLLPTAEPEVPGYEIYAKSEAAELVGGDLYDFHYLEDEQFGFCIGDASGHGIPAALMVRDAVTGLRMGIEKHMKMTYTLEKLNKVIYQSVYSTRFISLFYAEMELNGNLFYVNAGHPSPFIVNGDKVTELESTGTVFGALPEINLRRSYAKLEPGSVLCLFTDGVFERQNSLTEEFGLERLYNIVIENRSSSSKEILDAIFNAVSEFGDFKKWQDDTTVVIIKRLE